MRESASARESQRNRDRRTDTEQGRAGSLGKERKKPTHTKSRSRQKDRPTKRNIWREEVGEREVS